MGLEAETRNLTTSDEDSDDDSEEYEESGDDSEEEFEDEDDEDPDEDDDDEEDDDEEDGDDDDDEYEEDDDDDEEDDDDDDDEEDEESGAFVKDEENPEAFEDEARDAEKEEKEPRDGARICGIILCCCCCILVIVGIILGLFVFGGDDDGNDADSKGANSPTTVPGGSPSVQFPTLAPNPLPPSARPPPTRFPTKSPSPSSAPVVVPTPKPTLFPTLSPTVSPEPSEAVPDELELGPFADTTVYTDGFDKFEAFGAEDTMLVQDGLAFKTQIPDAYALLAFDLTDVPHVDRLYNRDTSVILRLAHVASADVERGPATLNLVKLPSTRQNIESFHGGQFFPNDGIDGPTFEVSPTDTTININVTDLVYNYTIEDDQIFLMIENRGPEQEAGDRFKTRESDEPPQLLFTFACCNENLPPTRAPTASPKPSASPRPTVFTNGTMASTASPTLGGTSNETVIDGGDEPIGGNETAADIVDGGDEPVGGNETAADVDGGSELVDGNETAVDEDEARYF